MVKSNLFVKNIPSIKEREFKYRTKIDSHSLNELQKESFNDILDLFNKANKLQKNIYEMNMANMVESAYHSKRLNEAIQELEHIKEKYDTLLKNEADMRQITRFAYEAETEEDDSAASVDKNTNDITAHISGSVSKIRMYDETYDEILVPSSLQKLIGPDTFRVGGSIYSIEDTDIDNAFDGNNSSVWVRKVITSESVESIENEIVIGLPENIITSRLINQITLCPFPAGHIDIMDIMYKSNGSWRQIPGFKKHYGCEEHETHDIFGNTVKYHSINNAGNMRFNFHNIQTNQIKIKIRQRNYEPDTENARRVWYLGLRDINILYNTYTRDRSEFEMVYEFPEKDKNIKIYDTEVFFNNENTSDDKDFGVTKEYFYFDANGNAHKTPNTVPFVLKGHKVMVRFTIEGTQTTPNIYKCSVKYMLA